MNIEDLIAEIKGLRSRASEIDTEFAGRSMTPEAREEWNTVNASIDDQSELLQELRSRRARLETIAADPANVENDRTAPQIRRSSAIRNEDIWDLTTVRGSIYGADQNDLRERSLRAIEHSGLDADQQAHVSRLVENRPEAAELVMRTGSPQYRSAFAKYLAGQPMTGDETRAAMSLTNANGGYAVPYTLDPSIIFTGNGSVNPLRLISRVETISTDVWKGVSSAGITVSRDSEAQEVSDDSPTVAQPTVDTSKVQGYVQYSIEIGGDWQNFLSQMGTLLAIAKDDEEASYFTTRLLAGVTTAVTASGTGAFAAADVYSLNGALPARYRGRSSIVANDAIYGRVRQFDTNGGSQLWKYIRDGRNDGDLLAGRPAYELSNMGSAITTGSVMAIQGDFSNFVIADRLGMSVETVQHVLGTNHRPTGERGLYAYWRNGAEVVNANAFRKLVAG